MNHKIILDCVPKWRERNIYINIVQTISRDLQFKLLRYKQRTSFVRKNNNKYFYLILMEKRKEDK